jgi:hypothetical protein
MVLSIEIPPRTEERLRKQAEAAGKDVNAYVSQIVEQAAAKGSLEEELAGMRRRFAGTGIGDDELIQDITAAQAEYRAEKHKKPA